ncbi:mannose-6-phosphate isomerase 2-like [Hibiscus syriacus]|uniref:mannose-6-phosphate isomerase 2-like n=1 Tax=Hibiscus syriacus TaxID=106335 RepID=UPI001923DA8D|nr:mannose-6-phosphate isomerase 2-like [Hibiscus syriacus]
MPPPFRIIILSAKTNVEKVKRLRSWVHNYDWGRCGMEAQVARLLALNSGFEIKPDRPYAEFWMGTHDSGPSFMADNNGEGGNLGLKDWILKNTNVFGHKVLKKWGPNLPFLFKVLSVEKPLSIQAHPDKELAKELHKLKPNLYKDANHKPEMALAVTKFRALCGSITLEVKHESCSVFGGGTSLSWLSSSSVFTVVTKWAVVVTEGCRKIMLQYYGFKLASDARYGLLGCSCCFRSVPLLIRSKGKLSSFPSRAIIPNLSFSIPNPRLISPNSPSSSSRSRPSPPTMTIPTPREDPCPQGSKDGNWPWSTE